jgi:hypothetical protein
MPGDNQGIKRRVTDPVPRVQYADEDEFIPPPQRNMSIGTRLLGGGRKDDSTFAQNQAAVSRKAERADSFSSESSEGHHVSRMVFKRPEEMVPGDGLYQPPQWLDEWRKGTTGTLSGTYLEIEDGPIPIPIAEPDTDKAWWEQDKRKSFSAPRNAAAFDGEYDEQSKFYTSVIPLALTLLTRFQPLLVSSLRFT